MLGIKDRGTEGVGLAIKCSMREPWVDGTVQYVEFGNCYRRLHT